MSNAPRLHLGIDAGGTSTRAVVQRASFGSIKKASGPSAQLQRLGIAGAAHVLAQLVERVLADEDSPCIVALVAGVAGAATSEDQQALADALSEHLGPYTPEHLRIVQDAEIALAGAFEGESGLAIVAGTGSVLVARGKSGAFYKAGGWGYLLGDAGSGYALGLAGLRAAARAYDGGPKTLLWKLLAERLGINDRAGLIRKVYQSDWPLQEAAPLVLEAARQGDAVARQLTLEQARTLARQAREFTRQYSDITQRFALLGGLTSDPFYHDALAGALRDVLPDWEEATPRLSPVMGALLMARDLEDPLERPDSDLIEHD